MFFEKLGPGCELVTLLESCQVDLAHLGLPAVADSSTGQHQSLVGVFWGC